VGAAVLAGQLTVGWDNDWLDAERDGLSGRADKPVARGEVPRALVGRAAAASGVATVPLSLLSGWQAGLAHVVAVALALVYNWRLKATITSFLPYLIAFPLLVAFVTLGRHPGHWPPWWALAGAGLLGTGAHLANAAPDVAQDTATGVRGLPQRLGARRSVQGALGLMLAATVIVTLGPGRLPAGAVGRAVLVVALVVVATVALALGARAGRASSPASGPRAWFRASMLVALANVALLAARGASL
jgi:4-hydroxybenzoate polyprenyltransferase